MTQHELILDYINRNGSITRKQASYDLGIESFTARISEMRRKGIRIEDKFVKGENRFGAKCEWKVYTLAKDTQ